ncbi:hypothetical protein BCU94_15525 [Shewanella sp. 10N.286.52.C2]|uniref:hypothetical protein n=1 Tax=Shewanella sp. 10N.286.52.C2 TaxID=1880838 RepID=UPI000C836DBA|nr:hypothetical protein [Shewanella sp. 10N.286.52.C2]PMG29032.1 hypothetical protein BCU94_15525 [Shewanella sp. 10N.286.52.C2]
MAAKCLNQFLRLCLYLVFAVAITACSVKTEQANISQVGNISHKKIAEASGLAYSNIHHDVLWLHNDGGDSAAVYAINLSGDVLATVNIEGVKNIDWEDMSSFIIDGKAYLLIADVGDNRANRSQYFIHIIAEPDVSKLELAASIKLTPLVSLAFNYPDGPKDCESVAVDVVNQQIVLLSKRHTPQTLYQLPLPLQLAQSPALLPSEFPSQLPMPLPKQERDTLVATPLGAPPALPESFSDYFGSIRLALFAGNSTAMSFSKDGLSAVVLTYGHAYYFQQQQPTGALTLLSTTPKIIDFPTLFQAEAVSFNHDASRFYITSEGSPAPIYEVNIAALLANSDYSLLKY